MHADRMLKEFSAVHRRNLQSPWGAYEGYVVPATNDPAKLAWLTSLLDANGIKYGSAASSSKGSGLNYATMRTEKVSVQRGDLVIDARQPQSSLLQVFMDPNPELSDSLTYDITTWALPYAYGLEAYAMTSAMPAVSNWNPTVPSRDLQGEAPAYAYVLDYSTDLGTPVLAALLNEGVTARLVKRSIEVGGATYPRGSIVVTRRNNEALWPTMAQRLEQLTAGVPGMEVARLESGMVTSGPDLGAYDVAPIDAPRVAVVMGDEVSSLSFGEVWFTFEEVWDYPMTAVRGLDWLDWDVNDVVVLPRGWYGIEEGQTTSHHGFGPADDLWPSVPRATWGLTVGDSHGTATTRTSRLGKTNATRTPSRTAMRPTPCPTETASEATSQALCTGSTWIPPIRSPTATAMGTGTSKRRPAATHMNDGHNVGILGDQATPISGFAGVRANAQLQESLSFGVMDLGQGHVIYLADNVLFRAFWKYGHKFFANAIFFSSAM